MEKMTSEQAIEAAKGLTFEKVWAALMETRERMEESARRSEEDMAKLRKELGRIGISVGDQVEAMFTNLWAKFNALGFQFDEEAPNVKFIEEGRVVAEADYLLQNGKYIMSVEVKAKLTNEDVDGHIKRLDVIKQYRRSRGDTRKILGAVAGAIVAKNVLTYAQSKGLYVLTQNGNAVDIAELPDGFIVKEW